MQALKSNIIELLSFVAGGTIGIISEKNQVCSLKAQGELTLPNGVCQTWITGWLSIPVDVASVFCIFLSFGFQQIHFNPVFLSLANYFFLDNVPVLLWVNVLWCILSWVHPGQALFQRLLQSVPATSKVKMLHPFSLSEPSGSPLCNVLPYRPHVHLLHHFLTPLVNVFFHIKSQEVYRILPYW